MKRFPLLATIFVVGIVLVLISLISGRVWLHPIEVIADLLSPEPALGGLIVMELRLPRTLLALLVGTSLGLAGAVLQGMTRNPLAEPGLLGVSTGAALGAVLALYFGLANIVFFAAPIMGLIGALTAMTLTLTLGQGGGTLALILAGSAVSGLAAALVSLSLNLAPNPYAANEIMMWLLGSLSERSWNHLLLVLPFIVVGCALLACTGKSLDALSLGEVQAQSLGINLARLRLFVLFGTALAVGAATAVTGAIGFIGLMAPHLVRPFVGYQPSRVLLPAAALGAVLLLGADIATRLIRFGPEFKLGVFTSLLGTPFFFWLVVRLRKIAP